MFDFLHNDLSDSYGEERTCFSIIWVSKLTHNLKPISCLLCDQSHFAISIHRQPTCGSRATHGESAIDNQGLSSDVGGVSEQRENTDWAILFKR